MTGLRENSAVLNAGLEASLARKSARRLIELGGTEKQSRPVLKEEFLLPMGISQYRLAKEIGVAAQRIGEIVTTENERP